jgi:D-lactate dehydrogenase
LTVALNAPALSALQAIFSADGLSTDAAARVAYAYDNSRREALPDAVVFPTTHEQVLALVRACREHRIALTARGRGTNTTGASVPITGGIVASFERMNRILRIETGDRYAVVEPGVLNADLQAALKPLGFFWAPDPTSAPYCSVGGNIACNAGGPRAVKYGATRDNVLALRAINGCGEEFRCGKPTTKGATGYDLTRLLIGSEGTLAVITEATLKLTPLASDKRTLRAAFVDVEAAAAAVARIMAQPVTPCALEFMDDDAVRLAREHAGPSIPEAGALLVIEVDGETDSLDAAVAAIRHAAAGPGLIDLHVARDAV